MSLIQQEYKQMDLFALMMSIILVIAEHLQQPQFPKQLNILIPIPGQNLQTIWDRKFQMVEFIMEIHLRIPIRLLIPDLPRTPWPTGLYLIQGCINNRWICIILLKFLLILQLQFRKKGITRILVCTSSHHLLSNILLHNRIFMQYITGAVTY